MELSFSPLECGLDFMTHSQGKEYAKGEVGALTVEKLSRYYLNQVIKINITSDR